MTDIQNSPSIGSSVIPPTKTTNAVAETANATTTQGFSQLVDAEKEKQFNDESILLASKGTGSGPKRSASPDVDMETVTKLLNNKRDANEITKNAGRTYDATLHGQPVTAIEHENGKERVLLGHGFGPIVQDWVGGGGVPNNSSDDAWVNRYLSQNGVGSTQYDQLVK